MSSTIRSDMELPTHPRGMAPRNGSRRGFRKKTKQVSQSYWAQEQDRIATGVAEPLRWSLLRQHGSFSMAYSTAVQPRLRHFGDERGFIAYRQRFGQTIALGDPVASPADAPDLLRRFIQHVGRPTFCQVSPATANRLAPLGYRFSQMGVDTSLDLTTYQFAGKSKEWLRYASNWVGRRGYAVQELSFSELAADQVEALSEAWRKTRTIKRKEVRFLNRPIVLADEPDVRKFYLVDPAGQIQALVFLDPIYRDGGIAGYVTAFKRRHPNAPQYAEQALMKGIIERLQDEGIPQLKLGLSPLAFIECDSLPTNGLTRFFFQRCYRSKIVNRYFYHLQGHAHYKRRFRGVEEKSYFASPGRIDGLRMAALIGLCGIA